MTIRELVGGEVMALGPQASLREAAELMKETDVGSVAVAVDDALEGILTERDLLRAIADYADFDRDPLSGWMTELPDVFGPDMGVEEAADWMLATGYRHLPVVDGKRIIGMVSIKDILWALKTSSEV